MKPLLPPVSHPIQRKGYDYRSSHAECHCCRSVREFRYSHAVSSTKGSGAFRFLWPCMLRDASAFQFPPLVFFLQFAFQIGNIFFKTDALSGHDG
jgi:hypothetical protein